MARRVPHLASLYSQLQKRKLFGKGIVGVNGKHFAAKYLGMLFVPIRRSLSDETTG
ncbi:MAG: hypothetical protein J7502_09765 [Flavisolibacter sp.]|nr:hypothetical protein [Flavisolibacter sp.]